MPGFLFQGIIEFVDFDSIMPRNRNPGNKRYLVNVSQSNQYTQPDYLLSSSGVDNLVECSWPRTFLALAMLKEKSITNIADRSFEDINCK